MVGSGELLDVFLSLLLVLTSVETLVHSGVMVSMAPMGSS